MWHLLIKCGSFDLSKYNCWKVLRTVASHLKVMLNKTTFNANLLWQWFVTQHKFNATFQILTTMFQDFESLSRSCSMMPQWNVAPYMISICFTQQCLVVTISLNKTDKTIQHQPGKSESLQFGVHHLNFPQLPLLPWRIIPFLQLLWHPIKKNEKHWKKEFDQEKVLLNNLKRLSGRVEKKIIPQFSAWNIDFILWKSWLKLPYLHKF